MLILGTKAQRSTISSGTFVCPACASAQPYCHMTAQKQGHLFFISLVPMGDKVEYVECQTCQGTWHPQVLQLGVAVTSDGAGHAAEALLDVLILAMISDGEIKAEEKDTVVSLYERITGSKMGQSELKTQIINRAVARGDRRPVA